MSVFKDICFRYPEYRRFWVENQFPTQLFAKETVLECFQSREVQTTRLWCPEVVFSVHNNLKTLISQPKKVSQRIVPSNRVSCLKVEFLLQKHLPTSHKHFLGSEDSSKQLLLRFLNLGSNKIFIFLFSKSHVLKDTHNGYIVYQVKKMDS